MAERSVVLKVAVGLTRRMLEVMAIKCKIVPSKT
jgi:hypothetical protein